MTTGSIIPPDVRAGLAKQGRGGGIGGRAPENADAARARAVAMDPEAVLDEDKPDAPATDEREELKVCPRTGCRTTLDDEWNFCAKCGTDLIRGGPAKKLGIDFKESDLQDYIFRGHVVREVTIFGKHKILLKSSTPHDIGEADEYLMNGPWRKKNPDGSLQPVSEFYLRQINQLCITAGTVQKMDGESIGGTFTEKMAWFDERGTAMVDMIAAKVILFNKALTEFLTKADVLSGS